MSVDIKLLSAICQAPGAPGYEKKIRELVLKEVETLGDAVEVDNMGNVRVLVTGKCSEKKAMAAAHMDEIGFMVKYIDDEGFIRFQTMGGFDPKTLVSQRVIIHGKKDIVGVMGCKPIHIMSPEERKAHVKISDFFIDTGLSKEKLEELVEVGNPITRDRELIELGDCVNVKSLDNRVCVYVLIETLKKLKKAKKKPHYDFYAVFTVQEEVGLRGARAATLDIQPDFGFGLDTTIACDTPGTAKQDRVTCLGEGAAIKVYDASTICDYRMVEYMKERAKKAKIKWQPEILAAGGTDTACLQTFVAGGSIAGALSVPTRYIHQVIETSHKEDIQGVVDLLVECVCGLGDHDWSL